MSAMPLAGMDLESSSGDELASAPEPQQRWGRRALVPALGLLSAAAACVAAAALLSGPGAAAAAQRGPSAWVRGATMLAGFDPHTPSLAKARFGGIVDLHEQISPEEAAQILEFAQQALADDKKLNALVDHVFQEADKDGSKFIEKGEFKAVVDDIAEGMGMDHPTEAEITAMMESYDKAGNGKLSKKELKGFVKECLQNLVVVLKAQLATSIVQQIKHTLEHTLHQMTHQIFSEADKDHSGFIEKKEFSELLTDIAKAMGIEELTAAEHKKMMKDLDTNKDDKLTEAELEPMLKELLEDLMSAIKQQLSDAITSELEAILSSDAKLTAATKRAFEEADTDKSGFIEDDELEALMKEASQQLGVPPPTDDQRKQVLKQLDKAGNNKLSEKELKPLIKMLFQALVRQVKESLK